MRWPLRVLGLGAIAVLGAVVWLIGRTTSVAYQTEVDYLMSKNALDLVATYVIKRGDWPRSWGDLEHLQGADRFVLRADWPRLKERIAIDFGAKIGVLKNQRVEDFQAIHTSYPSEFHPEGNMPKEAIGALLTTLREVDWPGGDR